MHSMMFFVYYLPPKVPAASGVRIDFRFRASKSESRAAPGNELRSRLRACLYFSRNYVIIYYCRNLLFRHAEILKEQ